MTPGFRGALPPPRFNMAAYTVGRAARATPGKAALLVVSDAASGKPDEVWTYRQVEDAVLRIAGGLLAKGLSPGDRIIIRLDNTSSYALLFFGAIAAGLVPLATSTHLTEPEARFLVEDSGAAAMALAAPIASHERWPQCLVIDADDVARMLREAPLATYADTAADDPAYMIYTSGTTSKPKGVVHGQRAAWGRRPMYEGWYGLGADDRMLHASAFNWTYTLGTGLTDPWATGATAVVYMGEKDPALWPRLIASTGATIFAAVPTLYRQILKYGSPTRATLGALRHGLTAGETAPAPLFEEWERQTGTVLCEALGQSEMSTYISTAPTMPRKPGFIGKPQAGRAVAILPVDAGETPLPPGEEGLLAVHRSDPGLMLGYRGRPEEEAQVLRGQWFIGGDLAMMDADGYVAHRGRANDIMKPLGYRVSPLEVEEALGQHPAIAEVAAAEVEVKAGVFVIGAFIVPREGAQPTADAVKSFAAERLAPYKCPREVVVVDSLPRTANGKVCRSALTTIFAAQRRS